MTCRSPRLSSIVLALSSVVAGAAAVSGPQAQNATVQVHPPANHSGNLITNEAQLQPIASVPTVEMAIAAPAGDVARNLMDATWGLRLVRLAQMNETVVIPEGKITKDTAPQWQKLFAAREAIYRQAIARRGVASFAGSYRLSAESPSCARSGSSFIAMIGNQRVSGRRITITQNGYELLLKWADALLVGHREAWAVENSFAFNDPMNANYVHLGELNGDQLVIRPQADVVKSPPVFAPAPKEEDIRACAVVLTREKA